MPKQKSHSGTKKRFKVTKNGKVMARAKNRAHILEKKSPKRKQRLAGMHEVAAPDAKRVKRLLKGS